MKKAAWFRPAADAVLFLTATPHSLLADRTTEAVNQEKRLGLNV